MPRICPDSAFRTDEILRQEMFRVIHNNPSFYSEKQHYHAARTDI